jgi:hypothetical protein
MSTIDTSIPVPDDAPDDDVAAELEALAIRRRRKLPRVTLALCVAIVGAGAFIGGAEAQKHLGSTSSTGTAGSGAASGFASRFRGATGGTFGGGGATIGSVTAIKGSTLYVTDTSGNVVKVSTSAASQVSKTTTGTVKDIKPGDTVVVRGTQGKNGTIAAASISLGGGGSSAISGANGGATGFGFNGSSTKGGG